MEVKVSKRSDPEVLVMDIEGELDMYEAPSIKSAIRNEVDKGCSNVILNLGNISYIDSSGIGALISGLQHVHKNGGKLKLLKINETVRRSFMLVNIFKLFEAFDSEEEAIKSFACPLRV